MRDMLLSEVKKMCKDNVEVYACGKCEFKRIHNNEFFTCLFDLGIDPVKWNIDEKEDNE